MQSDLISRLKKLEREIKNCDIDEQYRKDKCDYLLKLFDNKGENISQTYKNNNLPVGKYQLSTYKYALKKYIKFIEESRY